jgi:erythronate-4-phosphate dehydrogenase
MKIIADENIPFVEECFSSIGDVYLTSGRRITAELLADADVLLVRSGTNVNDQLLGKSSVKFVATATIGYEHIDTDFLRRSGIGFTSAPGSNANSVAEYIVAALLAVAKKHKFGLEGKSIGIIGVGNVGSKVAQKTAALGMKVLLNDPPLKRQTGDEKYLPVEKLYDCDFITVHTPLTIDGPDKTFHLAGEEFFNSLKKGAFFLNTSRGAVADTAVVKSAIAAGKLAGTVLDVWENEPNIDNQLLLKADISTPHIAGYSFDGKVAGLIMIYNAVCGHFGIEPKHTAGDFLGEPPTPQITIDDAGADEQTILHSTVQQVYVINRDDFNTREILLVPQEERGKFFDDLRKNYPIRREFQNTEIILNVENKSLAEKLAGIGFTQTDRGAV